MSEVRILYSMDALYPLYGFDDITIVRLLDISVLDMDMSISMNMNEPPWRLAMNRRMGII